MEKKDWKRIKDLRESILRLAARGRSYNARISAARGPERHALRLEKAHVGSDAREALLAYAMLRGVPYRALEETCLEDFVPDARARLVGVVAGAAGTDEGAALLWMDGDTEVRNVGRAELVQDMAGGGEV